jgi:hypothetical protein
VFRGERAGGRFAITTREQTGTPPRIIAAGADQYFGYFENSYWKQALLVFGVLASCHWQNPRSRRSRRLAEGPEGGFQLADHLIQPALSASVFPVVGFERDESD